MLKTIEQMYSSVTVNVCFRTRRGEGGWGGGSFYGAPPVVKMRESLYVKRNGVALFLLFIMVFVSLVFMRGGEQPLKGLLRAQDSLFYTLCNVLCMHEAVPSTFN